MSPTNPLNIGRFQKFAIQQLYAELYPLILGDFKHKQDIAKIIDAMTVIQHSLIKPLSGSFEATGPARKAAMIALAKQGKLAVAAVEEGGVPFVGGIQR